MSRTNLDNIKTFHEQDISDLYESLGKFGRYFEKGFHESQVNLLPLSLDKISNLIICTDGTTRHLADFCLSLTPFFLHIPFEINTNYRLPSYANENSLVLLLSSEPHSEELTSIRKEIEIKKSPFISYQTNDEFQNVPYVIGSIFGLLTRLNPTFTKTLNLDEIFLTIEKTVAKVNRDLAESQNPAKLLAQKHSQKAILVLSSGHLLGIGNLLSGLTVRWGKTFSVSYNLPEANGFIEPLFNYPTKVLNEYQVLILSSDLYSRVVQEQFEKAKTVLSKKRINFSVLKPDTSDWFSQIFESLVFFTFFSYYLSIVNKAKL